MRRARFARSAVGLAFVSVVGLATSAHVGSSNAYFEGLAGPYLIRVIVRTPGVIPGLAQISVRVTDGSQPTRVTVQPLRWDAGLQGAPPADTATAVPGETGLYAAELWLMTTGSYSVRVAVAGPEGSGVAFVPVNALAERRRDMGAGMAVGLLAAALFLFVGAVTIFGAAVRESVVAPGAQPEPRRLRRGRLAMAIGGLALAAALWGGWAWWDEVDAAYRAGMFRPLATAATITQTGAAPTLTLRIDDPTWRGRAWTPLMPDHGKLMHMFLVQDGRFEGFAHLHPQTSDSSSFAVPLPPLPAGRYLIYADIVQESGFAQTLVDTVLVPEHPANEPVVSSRADSDDSWAELPPFGQATRDRFELPSRRTITWEGVTRPRLDEELSLRFRVSEPDGSAAALQPYTGMLSHAVVTNEDGSVFMHLHPGGSINMAAQDRFRRAEGEPGAIDSMATMAHSAPNAPGTVSFPFVFSTPGAYRVVVQVKVAGAVETAAFDVHVPAS